MFAKLFSSASKISSSVRTRPAAKPLQSRPVVPPQPSVASTPHTAAHAPTLSTCPACGGVVAVGAKTCPHCGKSKPTPKPPTKVTRKHLLIAGGVLVLFMIGIAQQEPAKPVDGHEIARRCAREIGMDPTSSQPVSMQDIRALDACLKRHGIDTSKR